MVIQDFVSLGTDAPVPLESSRYQHKDEIMFTAVSVQLHMCEGRYSDPPQL